MKSFSDQTISKEQLDQARTELNNQQATLDAKQTASIRKLRYWIIGLAVFNVVTLLIVILK